MAFQLMAFTLTVILSLPVSICVPLEEVVFLQNQRHNKTQHHVPVGNLSAMVEDENSDRISALMLDVFLPGWRECVDWEKASRKFKTNYKFLQGKPSTKCVPFAAQKPDKCNKEIWEMAMADVSGGKLKRCE